ncbi:MAG: hypothetical protein ABI743_01570 [bacterium]
MPADRPTPFDPPEPSATPRPHPPATTVDYNEPDPRLAAIPEPEIPLDLVLRPYRPSQGGLILAILAIIAVIGVFQTIVIARKKQLQNRQDTPEQIAMQALRQIGAAQQAYRAANPAGKYGTIDELKLSPNFDPDFEPASSIQNYSLAYWSYTDPVWRNATETERTVAPGEPLRTRVAVVPSTFTIIAVPVGSFRGLRTFAVCEDGTVRSAPRVGAPFEDACEWPPVPDR